jgi:hypothetical protein
LAQAVVALRQQQLALLSQLAALAHDRRLMQADLSETEQWLIDLRPASWARCTAQRRPPCR